MAETAAALARRARQFLVHCFLYYRLGESVISDSEFDALSEALRAERSAQPDAPMPHADVIEPVLGPEASGYSIRDYPPPIITAAFQLLYAHTAPAMEFAEFVERKGYRVG